MAIAEPHSRSQRNLLMLAYYYLPATTSGVQRAVRLAKYLPNHGYRVFVVTSAEEGTSSLPHVTYVPNDMTRRAVGPKGDRAAAAIQRILPYNEQFPWAPHAVAACRELIREFGISAVLSTSPPAGTHYAASWLKRRFGLKWIADFRDPLLGNPGRDRRLAVPYDHLLERYFFGYADQVIGVTDATVEHWRQRYPGWRDKFHVIWNGYDPAEAFPAVPLPARPYRVLSHVGVLYRQRHPFAILSALDRLTANGRIDPAGIRVRFVGEIVGEDGFRSHPAVASLQAKGCFQIHGQTIPRKEAMTEIATADYLLLLDIDNLDRSGYTVPAKIFDYALTGRPMLAATSPKSPVDRILAQSGIAHCCIYHNDRAGDIESKLLQFFELPSTPRTPSPWFLDTFDGESQAALAGTLLDGLLDT